MAVEYCGRGSRRPRIEEHLNTGRPTFLGTISLYYRVTDDGTKWRLAFVSFVSSVELMRQSSIDISARGDRFAYFDDVPSLAGLEELFGLVTVFKTEFRHPRAARCTDAVRAARAASSTGLL